MYDETGNLVKVLMNQRQDPGTFSVPFDASSLAKGIYFVKAISNGELKQSIRVVKN
ncbi:MAG: hypothetical protein NVS1B13_11520 [Flavisolibacter sp.]